jgi:periplasmic copper chaperone A
LSLRSRAALLLLATLAGCGDGEPREAAATDAWVRLPAVPGRPGAGYLTLTGGSTPRRLVAVESPQAERVELHQSSMAGGRMTMRRLDGVDLGKDAKVTFAPEGNHLMLFGIRPEVAPGGTMRLSLRFEKGQPVTVDAAVVAAGDSAP